MYLMKMSSIFGLKKRNEFMRENVPEWLNEPFVDNSEIINHRTLFCAQCIRSVHTSTMGFGREGVEEVDVFLRC